MDTTRRMDTPVIRVLKFDRRSKRFPSIPEVTVRLNHGETLTDVRHHAIVEFEGVRINGALLDDKTQQKALRVVVLAAAAFSDAGSEYDKLVHAETESGSIVIFSDDRDARSNVPLRRTLEQATSNAELLLSAASDFFLALYQGRHPNDLAFTCLGALAEALLGDDTKRDVLVQ